MQSTSCVGRKDITSGICGSDKNLAMALIVTVIMCKQWHPKFVALTVASVRVSPRMRLVLAVTPGR